MPKLMVTVNDTEQIIFYEPGESLKRILEGADLKVRAGCNGTGACGLCKVQVVKGALEEPTASERVYLEPAALAQGVRLACQVMPGADLHLLLLEPIRPSHWRCLTGSAGKGSMPQRMPAGHVPQKGHQSYGVALDIGTTHIRLSLFDMETGQWVCGRIGVNPQVNEGFDVVTRLMTAAASPRQAEAMSAQLLKAVGEALEHMSAREGIVLQQIVQVNLVGNTAMMALLTGRNYEQLLSPAHWMGFIDCQPESTQA